MSDAGVPRTVDKPSIVVVSDDGIDDDSFAARPMTASSQVSGSSMSLHRRLSAPQTGGGYDEGTTLRNVAQDSARHLDDKAGLGDVLVISGGSGYNDLVGATPSATYVMPISDDGGSSSEIIRVLGGPSIGDLRSRLIRLIPTSTSHSGAQPPPRSNDALHALLSYRLPTVGRSRDIKQEWMDILEGRHALWRGIEPERKECVRGFLVHFESEILRRAHRNFDFRGGSIGNFFLAAAQKFFRSIQSAIFLFAATALISSTGAQHGGKVLPVINTNHTATIAAILEDGRTIVGQCEISHPAPRTDVHDGANAAHKAIMLRLQGGGMAMPSGMQTPASVIFDPFQTMPTSRLMVGNVGDGLDPDQASVVDHDGENDDDDDEQDNISSPSERHDNEADDNSDGNTRSRSEVRPRPTKRPKRNNNIVFSKLDHITAAPYTGSSSATSFDSPAASSVPPHNALSAKIARLFYVNAYGNEVDPAPNPEYLANVHRCRTLLYSCGSLWTSIVPCLALRGVATAITTSPTLRYKILLLNTTPDRETWGLDALGFVRVIVRAMQRSDQLETLELSKVVTHVIYSPQGSIAIDVSELEDLGIRCVPVHLPPHRVRFDEASVRKALEQITTGNITSDSSS